MEALYRKHRPRRFKDVVGQEEAVLILKRKWKSHTLPHAILFHGPYGTGKTTLARVTSHRLKCGQYDLNEKNTADYRGIDSIREIRSTMNQAPIDGLTKVWILDEIHKATNEAQNAMLKLLEDPPNHVYFMLCTTEPEKLLQGIRQRCLSIKLNPIAQNALTVIVMDVCNKEGLEFSKKVIRRVIEFAAGSAREALQIIDRIRELDDADEQLQAIEKVSLKTATITIARMLIDTRTKWSDVAPILRELQNEDPEQIRHMVMGYGRSVLLKKDNPRAFRMIEAFRDHFYDSKFSGVVAACYELLQNG